MFQGSIVSVITDETTDDQSQSVVNVLFVRSARSCANTSLQPVSVNVKFVDGVSSAVISRIVTKTLTRYGIEFEDTTGFVSDNASYMVRFFKEYIGPLCKGAVHIRRAARTINIVGSTMQVSFPLVDKFVASMKKALHLSSRMRAFVQISSGKVWG